MGFRYRISLLSRLVVLPHSVFALPFALSALLLAAARNAAEGLQNPGVSALLLVVAALVFARTAAMAFNRLVDARFDALNPRTRSRDLPQGRISPRAVLAIVVLSSALFIVTAGLLGIHCLLPAPFVLLFLLGYSLLKRYTSLSHVALGISLALAPGGAWWVLRPNFEFTPLLLMGAVALWAGGFDILYSSQDRAFDERQGLHSLPVRLGEAGALWSARAAHALSVCLFFLVGRSPELNSTYFAGLALISALLLLEHLMVRPGRLERVNEAFFLCNGMASLAYFFNVVLSLR